MGRATRTPKPVLDLGERRQGGANTGKRTFLNETLALLTAARAFCIDFFLTHADKLVERVSYYSEKHQQMRERAISANEVVTWAEACTVATKDHPQPWPGWNFSERFPDLPFAYRRSVIKDAKGRVRLYLSNRATWEKSSKKKSRSGLPGAWEHLTLYQGTCELSLEEAKGVDRFVRLKVYDGKTMITSIMTRRTLVQKLLAFSQASVPWNGTGLQIDRLASGISARETARLACPSSGNGTFEGN
jgi:hypothetical protein